MTPSQKNNPLKTQNMEAKKQEKQENNKSLENLIHLAKKEGMPQDQLIRFLSCGYVPLQWQLKFHSFARQADNSEEFNYLGVGGSRGGGKSMSVFSQVVLDDLQRIPNLKALFIRQTGVSAKESFSDLIDKVLKGKVEYNYNRAENILFFKNGSKILLGGFRDDRDVDKYIGIEYDLMIVEELNQLTKERVEKLLGSLRTSKSNWRPRLYASFNPGGLGHEFVKSLFIIPYRRKTETRTKFIPATYRDNPYLNAEYTTYLEELGGILGKMWRDGDWDIFAGQFFNEWNHEVHTMEAFTIPSNWRRFGSYDHGRANPAVFNWYALDYDGNVYCYREFYVNKKDNSPRWEAEDIAKEVFTITKEAGEQLDYVVADSSIFSKTGFSTTIAEILRKNGIGKSGSCIPLLIPSSKDRIAGWAIVHEYLKWKENQRPKLRYFRNCIDSINSIPTLIHSQTKPEDLDSRGEDHHADGLQYFLKTLKNKVTPPQEDRMVKKNREWKIKRGFYNNNNNNDILGLKRFADL